MKIKLKKSVAHNDHFWEAGSVIEAEENFARYQIGIGDAEAAGKDDVLTQAPEAGPVRRSLEADAMEKAAASIVTAVARAARKPGKGDDA